MSAFALFGGGFGFNSGPLGFCANPLDMQAMSAEQLRARELALAPLMVNSTQRHYEALRNAWRIHDDWQMATLDERYRDFCGRLKLAIERHHAHSNS